ncbi:MAG: TonB-dependent receptor [Proteobacteria bacterium]|nr:TonB-dependent receptor [Pseudomonadota bacterium]
MIRPNSRLLLLSLLLAAAWAPPAWAKTDLTELSVEQLLDITIVGASKYEQRQDKVAAAVSIITRNEIKAFGWRTLSEALASLPGIHTTYDRQYSYLGTRGFGLPGDFNTRVLLTVNGNRWNDVVYDGASFDRVLPLDLDLIERIEFIPGPGGAVYGQNALFGVINVVTRSGAGVDGTELAVSYEGPQSARQGRATWGKTLDNGVDMLLSASAYKAKGEDLFFEYPGATDDPNFYANDSGVASGMDGERDKEFFTHLARGPWSFQFSAGDRHKDDPTASFYSEPLLSGQYERDRTLMTQLRYQDSFAGDNLNLSARLFMGRTRYTGLFSYGTPYFSTGSSDWQGVELGLLSTFWSGHKLMVGMEFQDNSRRDQTTEDIVDSANDIVIPGSGWRAGVYTQDEWALSETVTATLGLRCDRNDTSDNNLSPRTALIWQAAPDTTLKTMYGRAHREPNAYERDYEDGVAQVGNPELESETIDTLELVMDHRLRQNLNLRASVYQWSMQGLVTLGVDTLSGISQYQSDEDVKANGVELSADKTWDWTGRLRGSVSYQDVSYESGAGLDNSPQLLGKLNFSGPLPVTGLSFGSEIQYYSKRQAIDGTDLDGYWLSNLNLVADEWAKGVEVSLGLYNLFDVRYDHPGSDINWQNALEQDGRSLRLKVVYRF